MLPTVVDAAVECEVDEVVWHHHELTYHWDQYSTSGQPSRRRAHTNKNNNVHNARYHGDIRCMIKTRKFENQPG